MSIRALLGQPTGYLPVAMSLGALAMIVWFVAVHGVVHQSDEQAAAVMLLAIAPLWALGGL